jgi:hypothetical protein
MEHDLKEVNLIAARGRQTDSVRERHRDGEGKERRERWSEQTDSRMKN